MVALCLAVVVAVAASATAFANGYRDRSGETRGATVRADTSARHTHHRDLRVVVNDRQGVPTATVHIRELGRGGNVITVNAWRLTPGFHAWHIHSVGVCDPAGEKPFASAGPHFNPTDAPESMQAGVFPVLLAGENGTAWTLFVDANFALDDLLGPSGTAIVIHAAADNYANIPPRYTVDGVAGPDAETNATGDGGGRVACGVISPQQPENAEPDSAEPDSATPDSATPDSATPDSATPDSAEPDSATPETAEHTHSG